MCGIVGITSKSNNIIPDLIFCLDSLKYRGYDSCGVSILNNQEIITKKSLGSVSNLTKQYNISSLSSNLGIGHTRWATHGNITEFNAHPHEYSHISMVHNGIVNNYKELIAEYKLTEFINQNHISDSVIIGTIINQEVQSNPSTDITLILHRLQQKIIGSYTICILCRNYPNSLFAFKKGMPLKLGISNNTDTIYLCSDVPTISKFTNSIISIKDFQICKVTPNSHIIYDKNYNQIEGKIEEFIVNHDNEIQDNFKHHMLCEINYQPNMTRKILSHYLSNSSLPPISQYSSESNVTSSNVISSNVISSDVTSKSLFSSEINLGSDSTVSNYASIFSDLQVDFSKIKRIHLVACGSSYYACHLARHWLAKYTDKFIEVELSSEFYLSHSKFLSDNQELCIFVSQSGETADTINALRHAQSNNLVTMCLVNNNHSMMHELCDSIIELKCGSEIGVASTKSFTGQLIILSLLTLHIGYTCKTISTSEQSDIILHLRLLPDAIQNLIEEMDHHIQSISQTLKTSRGIILTGRGYYYSLSLEGSLKIKETSYIFSEGISSGELKHGSIALIDEDVSIIYLIPHDNNFSKNLSNLQELICRNARVYPITDKIGYNILSQYISKDQIIYFDQGIHDFMTPILCAVPCQLLAYYISIFLDYNPDTPRNLAKSVTVE